MIARRLRELREDRDIKQEEIAKILGVKQSAISKYEKGRAKYRAEDIAKLSQYYNISADYILGLINEPKPLYKMRKNF